MSEAITTKTCAINEQTPHHGEGEREREQRNYTQGVIYE